jgi:formylglycine-generating enzyme required for sulfatase activity
MATGTQRAGKGNESELVRNPTVAVRQGSASPRGSQCPTAAADQHPHKLRPALVLSVQLKPQIGPKLATKENPWINSLGMKFVPVPGTAVLFGIWDVRVRDYRTYAEANPGVDRSWENPQYKGVAVTPRADCPVVNVSWNDAKAFCEWLTKKERSEGGIGETQCYRLPQEWEWNRAAGNTTYPWGDAWPPPSGAGNYADLPLQSQFGGGSNILEGDDDAYAVSTPVGSFEANGYGLYDLGGNVWQWCEDWYNSSERYRVLRGASWGGQILGGLLSSHRLGGAPDRRFYKFGFRCVLADSLSD